MSKAPLPLQLALDLDGPRPPDSPASKAGGKAGKKSGKPNTRKTDLPKRVSANDVAACPPIAEMQVAHRGAAIVTPPAPAAPQPINIGEATPLEPVRVGELSPPLRDHERADRRETTAYDQYREMYASMWRYILASAGMAIVLHVTTSGVVTITHWDFLGIELAIDSRISIVAILILITIALALMAIVNATRSAALFRRCGLFYQSTIYPPDSPVLRLTAKAALIVAIALQCAVWSSVIMASIDLAQPHHWTVWWEQSVPSEGNGRGH